MKWLPFVAVIGLLLLIAFWPLTVVRVENTAKEDSKYIRRAYAEHTVGQVIATDHAVNSVQLLLRSARETEPIVSLHDEHGTLLSEMRVKLDDVDQWVRFPLSKELTPGEHVITISAKATREQADAALVRFQIDSDRYEAGAMVVDGEKSYGDVAFRLEERVALGQAPFIWGQTTDKSILRGLRYLGVGLAVLLLSIVPWRRVFPNPYARQAAPLIALFAFAVVVRVPYLTGIEGVFGGDAFNYLSKAQTLLQGGDPFAADPRKGPLLSLSLLPGFFTTDPLLWSRWVGVIAAAATVALLPLIGRALKLPWKLSLLAGLFLAVNPEFTWEAPSGLANSLYAFLIALAVYLYLRPTTKRTLVALAVTAGLIVLARYEGALVGAVLLPAVWWRERLPIRRVALLVVIAVLVAAVPLSSWFISGKTGVRTAGDVLGDEGLFLVKSTETLHENLDRLHVYLNQAWLVIGEKGRANLALPALLIGLLVGVAFTRKGTARMSAAAAVFAILLFIGLLFFSSTKSSEAREYLVVIPLFLIGAGVGPLIRARRYDALVLLLMIAAQLVVITLILPKSRYYLQLLPYAALLLAFGIHVLFKRRGIASRIPRFEQWAKGNMALATLTGGIVAGLIFFDGVPNLEKRLEVYNGRASNIAVMMEAAKYARTTGERVGFKPREEQASILYVPDELRYDYRGRGIEPASEELAWLAENKIVYAVERNREPYWESRSVFPDVFTAHKTFETIHGEEKVFLYAIDQEALDAALSQELLPG